VGTAGEEYDAWDIENMRIREQRKRGPDPVKGSGVGIGMEDARAGPNGCTACVVRTFKSQLSHKG